MCEDDARLVRELPVLEDLPRDGLTALGGRLRIPPHLAWREEKSHELSVSLLPGINEIDYRKFSLSGSEALFYPSSTVAKNLLDAIESSTTLTHFDLWLRRNKPCKYLFYPNPFATSASPSQIHPGRFLVNDLFRDVRAKKKKDTKPTKYRLS